MAALDQAIAGLTVLWGWRRIAVAVLLGALSAAALAPFHVLPVLLLTIPCLIWLLDGVPDSAGRGLRGSAATFAASFGIGWAFGFGYFLGGLYWVGHAFLVDADRFAWALPLAMALLPAGLALFTGLSAAVARLLWAPGYGRVLALAVAWTAGEWLRGTVLTGFPWNLIGHTLAGSLELMQAAAYSGDLGLSVLALLVAGAPATFADWPAERGFARRAVPTICALAALGLVWGFGAVRLAEAGSDTVPGVHLRVVQPNIPQDRKWDPSYRTETLTRYLDLSDAATSPRTMGIDGVTHLVWPETALPMLLADEPQAMAAISALLPDTTTLITGALRAERVSGNDGFAFYNSVYSIVGDGTITGVYDKRRLVPFGEFLPFQNFLEKLGIFQLTALPGGFNRGIANPYLDTGSAPSAQALICYEIIFSGSLWGPEQRPGWIVNVTNDAWFGDSSGPRQHFLQTRLRAVEEGVPIVRAANTGISAVIDPYGRVVHELLYGRDGVIDSALPQAIEGTSFARYRYAGLSVFLALSSVGLAIQRMQARRRTR